MDIKIKLLNIAERFAKTVNATNNENVLNIVKPIDSIVDVWLNNIGWKSQSSRYIFINAHNYLADAREKEALTWFIETYGSLCHTNLEAKLKEFCGISATNNELILKYVQLINNTLLNYIRGFNQVNEVIYITDKQEGVKLNEFKEGKLTIYRDINYPEFIYEDFDVSYIEQYKKHFPEFDDFIKFVALSRLSNNRKKSYMWLQAHSDWGKGFLQSCYANLNMLCTLDSNLVKKAFSGDPISIAPNEVINKYALWFDEFDRINSNLKKVENSIELSPKHQMRSSVQVYAKIFTSADPVDSLISARGVESQFKNRFSYINHSESKVSLRQTCDNMGITITELSKHVTHYIVKETNYYLSLTNIDAEKELFDVADKYSICNFNNEFNIEELTEEIRSHAMDDQYHSSIIVKGDEIYLKKPTKYIQDYLRDHEDDNVKIMVTRYKTVIAKALGECKVIRLSTNKLIKAVFVGKKDTHEVLNNLDDL